MEDKLRRIGSLMQRKPTAPKSMEFIRRIREQLKRDPAIGVPA